MTFYYYRVYLIVLFLCQISAVTCKAFRNGTQKSELDNNINKVNQKDHYVFRRLQVHPSSQPSGQPSQKPSTFSWTRSFYFTGSMQTLALPAIVQWIIVDITAAAGGADAGSGGAPGFGARVQATIPVTGGSVLNIFVGGRGQGQYPCGGAYMAGGWNGGVTRDSPNESSRFQKVLEAKAQETRSRYSLCFLPHSQETS
jgi:hypothetical protein